MNKYKNKYGLQTSITMFAFWGWALMLNMPELLEISGAIIIIQSMWIWKTDFKLFRLSEEGNSLADIKTETKALLIRVQATTEKFTADGGYDVVLEPLDFDGNGFNSLKEEIEKSEDKDLLKRIHDLTTEQIKESLTRTAGYGNHIATLLNQHMKLMANIETYNENAEFIKDDFISIEFLLIACGTIYWACGSYIYKGWFGLFTLFS